MDQERRRVHYSGRVQGVGFRATTYQLADGREVAGFVRNLPDGRVELVVEGESVELDAFLKAIRTSFGSKVRDEAVEVEPVGEPPFDGFSIRY
ncbi:acylphosphatase [Singulisphaera rosea]